MVVAGAKRHAKEIVELLVEQAETGNLYFYDDLHRDGPDLFYGKFPIIKDAKGLTAIFRLDNRFVLGTGGPLQRSLLAAKLSDAGGNLTSVIAGTARIGHFDVAIGSGANIMQFVLISNSVSVGTGCLINAFASIHHDVIIGSYSEISPRASLLGGVKVGSYCSVGSGAVILPDITVGNNVTIGAGAVVTRDIPANSLAVGVPAEIIKTLPLPIGLSLPEL